MGWLSGYLASLAASATSPLAAVLIKKLQKIFSSKSGWEAADLSEPGTMPGNRPTLKPHLPESRTTWDDWDKTGLWPLYATSRSIPLIGREKEKALLHNFLDSQNMISLAVISGGGGRGKTRLALDFCDMLSPEAWDVVFSPGESTLQDFLSHGRLKDWRNNKSTLVVIDYAAVFGSRLKRWVQILHEQQGAWPAKLRLILIERQADFDSGWLKDVCGEGFAQAALYRELFSLMLPLDSGFTLADKSEIFSSLLEKLSEKSFSENEKKEFADKLEIKDWANEPLYLMMAALCCFNRTHQSSGDAGGSFGDVLDWGRSELVFEMVKREETRFKRIAKERDLDVSLFNHLAACLTLMGGMDYGAFQDFLDSEPQASGHTDKPLLVQEKKRWFEGLKLALPQTSGEQGQKPKALPPILPDIVGEAFAMCQLADPVTAAMRCYETDPESTLTTLGRAAMDFWKFDFSTLKNRYNILDIEKCLHNILEKARGNVKALEKLAYSLPEQSLMLRAFAVEVYEALVHELKVHPSGDGFSYEADLAKALNNLGVFYSDLGRREEALPPTLEAAEIYRKLSEANPGAFLPGLAMSLNNLGNRYSELGQREEALPPTLEAVEIRRKLSEANPGAFLPGLAMSLNNLGVRYSKLGRREEAIDTTLDAVEIRRKLSKANPGAFLPDLANSLNNLGVLYRDLGRREEALPPTLEAAEIYRKLSEANPGAFLPDLANSLNNLGVIYSDLGRREEALPPTLEAVEIHRKLSEAIPAAFLPDLTISLNNLGERYSELGREEEARECAVELREIRRKLS